MLALAAYLLGIGMPETYPRAIVTRQAKRLSLPSPDLPVAQSGVTLTEMLQVTFITPLKMLVTEPIVIGTSLYLGFIFSVILSFFISIPVVLESTYNFDIRQVGLAFIAAIVGSLLAAATSIFIDRLTYPKRLRKSRSGGTVDIEYRLYPAMIGEIGITISLFWIAWTAKPTIDWPSPVLGTMLFVWGSLSVLVRLTEPIHACLEQANFTTSNYRLVSDLSIILSLRRLPSQRKAVGAYISRVFQIAARRRNPACYTAK